MPEYFFHISLELFPDPSLSSSTEPVPVNLSHAFAALKPFIRSPRPLSIRDPKFDTLKRNQVPRFSVPSASLFERTIAEQVLPSSLHDHRLDFIRLERADTDKLVMNHDQTNGEGQEEAIEKGIGTVFSGVHTKGRYTKSSENSAGEEWGVVHLYRDASETPGLYKDSSSRSLNADIRGLGSGVPVPQNRPLEPLPPARDEDCTMLCILAVPSYLTPADFLAFVGEKTRDQVSHFRMIQTSRQNRYMVLMKFRNGKRAREWQAEWNGRVFNSMEPETVHVVFLKTVEVMPAARPAMISVESTADDPFNHDPDSTPTFPSIADDPFKSVTAQPTAKPPAPRTSSLVELPTCPVCLERMDETTGLLTILCQHVFHCTCLQKWSGGGCPVCRYTHDDFSTRVAGRSHKYKTKSKMKGGVYADEYEVFDEPLECEACNTEASLWQCLICGKVGCGRYEGKHAYKHFEETGHTFAMDLESKRVWDYAGDVYVHRIIQDAAKPGEKLVELPGRRREPTALEEMDDDIQVAKMENIAIEYTHLLTSQLESQRVYFEEIVERAVDKASEASDAAGKATEEYSIMKSELQKLSFERDELLDKAIPSLNTERARLEKRAAKFEEMAKSINARYLEEKSLAGSLMERIKHLEETRLKDLERKIQNLEEDNATKDLLMEGLRDEHRDAMMQISAQEKLREMVANGELEPEDLVGATIEAGPTPIIRKGKRPINRKQVPNTNDSNAASNSSPHIIEDELTKNLLSKLGLDSAGQVSKGAQSWDGEKAEKLFDEFKTRMLEEGLLSSSSSSTAAAVNERGQVSAEMGGEAVDTKTSTKKRKGKGKK